jgi:hypothetical protein
MRTALALIVLMLAAAAGLTGGQRDPAGQARRGLLDDTLDLYVRDGLVYYRALRSDRGRLDRYVGGLATAAVADAPRDEQLAFWINAYNALVLRTVIDHYPIRRRSAEYPPESIRQIPGAFERSAHRVAGRSLTLDQIETEVLAGFGDPRVFLALGRGGMSSGRLRSEAFTPDALDRQLAQVAEECAGRIACVQLDRPGRLLRVNAIFSWRREQFSAAYASRADPVFASRSPIERAVVALIGPHLLPAEREVLQRNEFTMEYQPFDWSLNDLTGRGGR